MTLKILGRYIPIKKRVTILTRLTIARKKVPAIMPGIFFTKETGNDRTAQINRAVGSRASHPLTILMENAGEEMEFPTTVTFWPRKSNIRHAILAFKQRYQGKICSL